LTLYVETQAGGAPRRAPSTPPKIIVANDLLRWCVLALRWRFLALITYAHRQAKIRATVRMLRG